MALRNPHQIAPNVDANDAYEARDPERFFTVVNNELAESIKKSMRNNPFTSLLRDSSRAVRASARASRSVARESLPTSSGTSGTGAYRSSAARDTPRRNEPSSSGVRPFSTGRAPIPSAAAPALALPRSSAIRGASSARNTEPTSSGTSGTGNRGSSVARDAPRRNEPSSSGLTPFGTGRAPISSAAVPALAPPQQSSTRGPSSGRQMKPSSSGTSGTGTHESSIARGAPRRSDRFGSLPTSSGTSGIGAYGSSAARDATRRNEPSSSGNRSFNTGRALIPSAAAPALAPPQHSSTRGPSSGRTIQPTSSGTSGTGNRGSSVARDAPHRNEPSSSGVRPFNTGRAPIPSAAASALAPPSTQGTSSGRTTQPTLSGTSGTGNRGSSVARDAPRRSDRLGPQPSSSGFAPFGTGRAPIPSAAASAQPSSSGTSRFGTRRYSTSEAVQRRQRKDSQVLEIKEEPMEVDDLNVTGNYGEEDETMEVDDTIDADTPGPSSFLRPRAQVPSRGRPNRHAPPPPIVAKNPNREVFSQVIDGHKFFINSAGEITVNDDDLLPEDDPANYVERKYTDKRPDDIIEGKVPTNFTEYFEIPRHMHEYTDAVALRYPDDPQRGFLEAMKEEKEKLDEIYTMWSKIRDFPFSETDLDLVWDTTPMSKASRSMLPTRRQLAGVYAGKMLIEQTLEDLDEGEFSLPEDPIKCVAEMRERMQGLTVSAYTPDDCAMDPKALCLVDIIECNEKTAPLLNEYALTFPKTYDALKTMMESYSQFNIFTRMLSPRKFHSKTILMDLLKMVHEKYMPRGGMYLKFLLNLAFHFQYGRKSKIWQMVVFKEERLFQGIEFNQFGEPINVKYAPNIHDTLAAKAEKKAKQAELAEAARLAKAERDTAKAAKIARMTRNSTSRE